MRLLAGTSGFSYKEWKGSFYPRDLPASGMLSYYAERFPAVEINNTFYRLPNEQTLLQWAEQVPASFRFVLKASQSITHRRRLEDVEDPLEYLLTTSAALGEKRGPLLVQLPPNMKKDVERLNRFLDLVPRTTRTAFEFRHPGWFDEDVFAALRSHGAALCLADTEDATTPLVATADWGYLRLRREAYDAVALENWKTRISHMPWTEVWTFFKHEDEGTGPALARAFLERWSAGET
jgi:uncharacterized protein YecE (DUF72 family)